MAKKRTKYVCNSCGATSPGWLGKCPNCGAWESYVEEIISAPESSKARGPRSGSTSVSVSTLSDVSVEESARLMTGITEFDRVLGGGVMPGSIILVGGDPGVGKSTLMAQMCAGLPADMPVLYITGEESLRQVKLRSARLGSEPAGLLLMAETNLDLIIDAINQQKPGVVIIDSIQTVYNPKIESAPGSVSQVRESTALLMRLAKENGPAIFVVGHVTKEGAIAGPKVLEHMVDTVLQFEGERTHLYRILRTTKNRYGSTNEIGVFEMGEKGLEEVSNPSALFLSERSYGASGSTVAATMEGSRPILVEAQALVTPSSYGVPQRTATGFDYKRLQMILAVIEKRMGMKLGEQDVFVNIAGGVRVDDPAVDLAVATAIVSSYRDIPADSSTVLVGEIGLGGEIRGVAHVPLRVAEGAKLGFEGIVVPKVNMGKLSKRDDLRLVGAATLHEGINAVL